jgi:carbamate kinase
MKMTTDRPPLVVALGGNAISPEGGVESIQRQFEQTSRTAGVLADLVEAGYPLVITHGNGPQVGAVMRRVELADGEVYRLPLDICVADTQGGMGYMIAQCLRNELFRRGMDRCPVPLVTTVEVDRNDAAFREPSKPVGSYLDRDQAERLRRECGYELVEVAGRGMRRVVPSPEPLRVLESELIRKLVDAGELVIAGGGGGVPCCRNDQGAYVGCEAVIDKDRTSGLIATDINAGALLIATSVPGVALDFGTPRQRFVSSLTVSEATKLRDAGQFPDGSMGPKIEAAVSFLKRSPRPGVYVLVCDIGELQSAMNGRAGTRIVRD